MPILTFKEENHEYKLDGIVLPSVTGIISEMGLSGLPWDIILEFRALKNKEIEVCQLSQMALAFYQAGQFGNAAHKATELHDRGCLDLKTVDPAIIPYLEAWKKFKSEVGVKILEIEKKMFHPIYLFAGTLDRVVELDGRIYVLDIKTSVKFPAHLGLQTAAYKELYNYDRARSENATRRFGVLLKPDGTYRFEPIENKLDWNIFLSILTAYRWKMNNLK